jgi:hypothetical protein
MAPTLPMSKLYFIRDMIHSQSLTTFQMADAAECSEKTISRHFLISTDVGLLTLTFTLFSLRVLRVHGV